MAKWNQDRQAFVGEFWSREWISNVDLGAELETGKIDTPLRCAAVDACMAVEDKGAGAQPKTLATFRVSAVPEGWRVTARSPVDDRESVVTTTPCPKCRTPTHQECHPHNGCEAVLVEEIMSE